MRVGVLGSGPGGAAAALSLARGGAEVTVHRPAAETEKPCGGALPLFELDRLELPGRGDLPCVRVEGAVLESASGGRLELPLQGLRVYRRRELDACLLEAALAAGAGLVTGRIRRVGLDAGVTLSRGAGDEADYDALVAADGASSPSRRALGLSAGRLSLGLGASVALPEEAPPRLVLGFPDLADAYLWIFPRPGGVSVGIAYAAGELSDGAAGACLEAFLRRHLPQAAGGARYRYPIPTFGRRTLERIAAAAARRVLLVGDAAGLADPLTREGIRPAMRSGRWAAASLLADDPQGYVERVAEGLGGEMERAGRACGLFFDDRLAQWMLPVCRALPGARRVLADLLACRRPYRGLRRALLAAAFNRRTDSRPAPGPAARDSSS